VVVAPDIAAFVRFWDEDVRQRSLKGSGVIFLGVEWKMTPDPIYHAMATEISVASSAKTPQVKALTSRNSESSSSGAD